MLIATLTTISAWTTLKCKPCILPVSYDCCACHRHDGYLAGDAVNLYKERRSSLSVSW